jgi:enoyl-CoA hydratase
VSGANTAAYETIRVAHDGPIATVTIAREAQLNALSSTVMRELTAAAGQLEAAADVRVVVVTGAGEKAFVAGADIAEMQELSPAQATAFAQAGAAFGRAIETSRHAWIAAVNGFALGGGCEIALACDFIYASDRAKLGQPEVKLGVIPGFGGTQRLARRVGVAKAKELCMTGDTIDAAEALRIGLADAVVPHAELLGKVRELGLRIASNGPLAVAACKHLIHEGQSQPLEDALAAEQRAFGKLFASADQREGMAAFLAKPRRAAKFEGK